MVVNKLNALNRIFSRNTLRNLIDNEYDSSYISVVTRYSINPYEKRNEELISEIYCELKENYRNEYFYKNTLLNKLLLGKHSVNTTTALTEIPIAKSKADFVMINGKAVVYEIKTQLDNLERLETQINDYYRAFENVVVVTYEENVDALEKKIQLIGKPIGIYVIRKRGTISPIREPQAYSKSLEPDEMFRILRKKEYESILLEKYGYLPEVSQFKYYSECKKLFLKIPIEEAYQCFLKKLKARNRIEKEAYKKVPYELKFLAYFMNLKKDDYKKLEAFLEKQYGGV